MSDSVEPFDAPVGGAYEPPVAFSAFAATLRPQPVRDAAGRAVGLTPGHSNEIWLKLLSRLHVAEKHTLADWNALIDRYRNEPAHPSVTGV